MSIDALFYDLDKFVVNFKPQFKQSLLEDSKPHRDRAGQMHLSEVMTILDFGELSRAVLFHDSNYRTFKHFYLKHVCKKLRCEFPRLLSYSRFVEQIPRAFSALTSFLQTRFGLCSGISFIDSTLLRVCHNMRISSHRVMAGLAARGKTSVGWFYGFDSTELAEVKLHLVINDQGELLNVCFTPGNVSDHAPVPKLTRKLFGKLVGDKGYISQDLFEQLFGRGLQLITRIKKNMKNRLIPLFDKLLLRKRAVVETVVDQLKNISQIEHSRHRSPVNYFTEIVAGLIAYTYRDKLPSLNLRTQELALLNGVSI
jgi:Transposase DDE domain